MPTVESLREIIGNDAESLAELERLADANDGALTPAIVLEAARDEDSVLHRHFDWHDASAAEKYRLDQARTLIRSYKLHVVDGDGERTTRFYTNVVRGDAHEYRKSEEVMSIAALREQKRIQARRELLRVAGELGMYAGFAEAVDAVNAAVDKLDTGALGA